MTGFRRTPAINPTIDERGDLPGGVTAVINASACGVLQQLDKRHSVVGHRGPRWLLVVLATPRNAPSR
jgi:hypothetical protein